MKQTRESRNGILRVTDRQGVESFYPSTPELMRMQVEWYESHGEHRDRIVERNGSRYPMGDWSWNRQNKGRMEYVEDDMARELQKVLRSRFYELHSSHLGEAQRAASLRAV